MHSGDACVFSFSLFLCFFSHCFCFTHLMAATLVRSAMMTFLFIYASKFQANLGQILNFSFHLYWWILVVAQPEIANPVEPAEDPKPTRFEWKVDNFSRMNTKKLYSDVFVVGSFKWYYAYPFLKKFMMFIFLFQ